MTAIPIARVGAPPVRERMVCSPTSDASVFKSSGVMVKPQLETVVYAHSGLPFWKKLWNYVKDQPNIFVDTSSDYLNPFIVKKAVESLGYRKVLYGCDGPYGMKKFNKYDYSAKKSWIDSLQIPDIQKEFILGKNFLGLIR